MAFSDLTLDVQNMVLSNHDYLIKWLLFLFLISFSYYYLFHVWKKQTPTIYFTVVIIRSLLFGVSIAYLLASPITLLSMTPELSFQQFYYIHLTLYLSLLGVIGIVLFVDFLRYGVTGLFSLAGFNMNDPHAKEFANTFYSNKHFFKWMRRK